MKNIIFSMFATLLCVFSNTQISGFAVNLDSKKKFNVERNIKNIVLLNDVKIKSNEGINCVTKNGLAEIVEASISSKKASILFIVINNKTKESFIFFKGIVNNTLNFYDDEPNPTYSYDISRRKIENFKNYDTHTSKVSCYKRCRAKAYEEIESDWLSDLACSINPCCAMIALHCGGCSGLLNC